VLTREAVTAEGMPGGFSAIYEVLRQLEERAHVRRGYFIANLGAAQFALPGVEERLRATRSAKASPLVLAATDPANPYGAIFPWPTCESPGAPSPQRAQGTQVILLAGRPLAWLARGGEHLVTFPGDAGERHIATALRGLVERGRRPGLLLTHVDGAPAATHGIAQALRDAGFVRAAGSLVLRAGSARAGDARRVLGDP
jgi:ATP-dependent Lhr-like helicase